MMNIPNPQHEAPRPSGLMRRFLSNGGGFVLITLSIIVVLLLSLLYLKSHESHEVAIPSSFSQTDLGDGWTRYESFESPRFAVSLPSDWQLSAVNIEQTQTSAAQALDEIDPDIANMMKSETGRKAIKCCLKMAASDTQSTHARVIIFLYPEQTGTTLDSLLRDNEESARQSGVLVTSARINSKAGEAGQLKLETSMSLPSGKITKVYATENLFLKDQNVVTMTLGSSSESATNYVPIFDRIGQSFEWL